MANKLKDLFFSSVDLVKRGANQDADIKLHKSADYEEPIMKSEDEIVEMLADAEGMMHHYTDALQKSFSSILESDEDEETMRDYMTKSLSQFQEAVENDIISEISYAKSIKKEREEPAMKGNNFFENLDKSNLTAEEQETFKSLFEKACAKPTKKAADPEDDIEDVDIDEEEEVVIHGKKPMTKSALPPIVQAALERMEGIAKNVEMGEMHKIAKKYEVLGEDAEKLAGTLYEMKKSNEDNYNAYVAVLDKSLDMLNKSGMFGEIGKSYAAPSAANLAKGETLSKVEAAAQNIMKSAPGMSYSQAMAKAWEQNPELAVAYENEFNN